MALNFLNNGYFAGKVGIIEDNPTQTLHVGDGTIDAVIRSVYTDGSYTDIHGYGIFMSRVASYIKPVNDNSQSLYFGDVGTGANWLSITSNAATNVWKKDATEFMRLNSSGNLGIGTDSPTSKLDIRQSTSGGSDVLGTGAITIGSDNPYWTLRGTATSLQDLAFDRNYSGTWYESMRIQRSTGNVGIGTTSPGGKLEISKSQDTTFIITSSYNGSWATQNYGHIEFKSEDLSGTTDPRAAITGLQFSNGAYGGLGFSTHGLSGSLAEAMRIDQAGNVGIGTTSPSKKLEVVSNTTYDGIQISGSSIPTFGIIDTTNSAKFIAYVRDSDATIGMETNHPLTINTNNTERVRVTAAGNVGIGTTSPNAKLQVNDNVRIGNTSTGVRFYIQGVDEFRADALDVAGNGWNSLHLRADGTDGLFLQKDTNNVGIGTTSPTQKLHVAGNARVTGAYYDSNNSPGTANQVLVSTVTGTDWVDGSGSSIIGGPYLPLTAGSGKSLTGDLYLTLSSSTQRALSSTGTNSLQIGDAGVQELKFKNASGTSFLINSSGNLGIGTTSPTAELHVKGDSSSANLPTVKIESTGSISYLKFFNSSTGTGSSDGTYIGMNGGTAYLINKEAGNLYLGTGDAINLTLENGGDVGIGTTSPTAALHVYDQGSGEVKFQRATGYAGLLHFGFPSGLPSIRTSGNFAIKASNAWGADLYINSSGNVGIGTTSPSAKLEVTGNTRLGSGTFHVSSDATLITSATYTFRDGVYINNPNSTSAAVASGNVMSIGASSGNTVFTSLITTGAIGIGKSNPSAQLDVVGTGNFTGLVSGITPVNAANFVTKAYVDGSSGGTGPFLPLAGGTMTGNTVHNDNVKSIYGTASDGLEIYHDGTDSIIADTGTGNLYIRGAASMRLQGINQSNFLIASQGGNVNLYYNNANKFNTSNTGVNITGEIELNDKALLSNQENTNVDTGAEVVAQVSTSTYTAAFFDFVIKKVGNIRSGTVYACHDGTNVEFTETSTQDLGDTSDVTLSVDISGGNMRLRATTTSDDWSVKSLIRAI